MSILILGTHGQFNHGDELLLETFLANLSDPKHKIYVNSYTPEATESQFKRFDIKTFHTRKNKIALLKYMAKCDLLIFAGGSVIKELNPAYGGDRYGTLNILNQITLAARAMGKPVIFANIGIGPLTTPEGFRLARQILNRSELIGVRDIESVNYADKLNLKNKATHVPDAVFSLEKQYFGESERANLLPSKNIKVAVNITRNISNPENWDYFFEQICRDLTSFAKQEPRVQLIGLAMQEHESANDYELLDVLKKELKKRGIDIQIPRLDSPNDAAILINQCDLVIAEKLHAVILAAILHKPFVALEYDIKVKGVCLDLRMSEYSVDINTKFKPGAIKLAALSAIKNYAQIVEHLEDVTEKKGNEARSFFALIKKKIA